MKRLLLVLLMVILLVGCEGVVYEVSTGFRHFETVEELEEWLNEDDTDLKSMREQAFTLQQRAAEDGYLLSAWMLPPGYALYGLPIHNIALIGDTVYAIRGDEVELWFIFTSYP